MSTGRSSDLATALRQAMGGGEEEQKQPEEEEEEEERLPTPEGGWSKREKELLRFQLKTKQIAQELGLEKGLTDAEALSLEGDDEADWRDQARRILEARKTHPLLKALEGLPPRQRWGGVSADGEGYGPAEGEGGGPAREGGIAKRPPGGLRSPGSYGIGDDHALVRDVQRQLGIRR